jgi:hypothetical protein
MPVTGLSYPNVEHLLPAHFESSNMANRFIAADAYWTLSMACNVYLIFFHKYDAEKIRTIEKWYFLACYGLPFIPAFAYLFVVSSSGNRAYGNATLWCWISSEFDVIRVATSYAPIW